MINHQIPIIWAGAELDGAGRKKLHIHLPYKPNNLTQDDCVSLHLTAADRVFTPPPLPIIGLPEMADIGRYKMSFDATHADGMKYGDVFTGGLLVSSGRCLEWGPLLADMDYANMGVQTIDPSGPVQESYGGLSHSAGGLVQQNSGASTVSGIPGVIVGGFFFSTPPKGGQRAVLFEDQFFPPGSDPNLNPNGAYIYCESCTQVSECKPRESAICFKANDGKTFSCSGSCGLHAPQSVGALPFRQPTYAPSNVQAGGYGLGTMPYNNNSNRLL